MPRFTLPDGSLKLLPLQKFPCKPIWLMHTKQQQWLRQSLPEGSLFIEIVDDWVRLVRWAIRTHVPNEREYHSESILCHSRNILCAIPTFYRIKLSTLKHNTFQLIIVAGSGFMEIKAVKLQLWLNLFNGDMKSYFLTFWRPSNPPVG